jgi:hypothetical protein
LYNELLTVINSWNAIDLIYRQCAANLPFLTDGIPPGELWREAINNLASHGALRRLCELVLERGLHQRVHAAVQAVIDAQDPTEVRIISNNLLVLDRGTLRQQLASLVPDDTPVKVLLVRGSRRSGKSHSRYLFELAARDRGAKPVYAYAGIIGTVDEAILQLFTALEASKEIPPSHTSEDAWYRVVCFKLLELASSKGRPLWIVVDDLGLDDDGQPLLDTAVRRFYEQFALNMLDPQFRQWFRLMLIHYPDGPTPTKWREEFWVEDRTSDVDINQQDIVHAVQSWSLQHGRNIVEEELTRLANEVIAQAEARVAANQNTVPRLRHIHNVLTETLKQLEGS